ncbi:MAG: hypothetical protein M3Y07_06965 [Acidobacteriota bacterium]|nr:hypothetical protein [Acidobacteriota bacterium]
MSVDAQSPLYNEKNRANIFYAESWALTHMLVLSPGYGPHFTSFLNSFQRGDAPAAAFQQAYGKSIEQVRDDLMQYVRGSRFFAGLFDAKLEKSAEKPDVESASDFETGMALADLLNYTRKKKEANDRYEALSREYPREPQPESALGYAAWRSGDKNAAIAYFAKAAERNSPDAKLYYDYAGLRGSVDDADSAITPALEKAVKLNPASTDARTFLASRYANRREYPRAIEQLSAIKRVEPDRAHAFFQLVAYVNLQVGNKADAKINAERARKYAKGEGEIAESDRILKFLEQDEKKPPIVLEATATSPATTPATTPATPSPTGAPLETPLRGEKRISIDGVLKQVDCFGKSARLRLRAVDREVALLIANPASVAIKNAGAATHDFMCGPQKEAPVMVEYVEKPNERTKTIGDVRSIEFK